MLPAANAGAFALTALALIVIPGPTVLFVIGRSLALGRKAGFVSVLGNSIGMVPAIVAVSFGVGALVAESLLLFTIIKFAGAAYVIYLGVQTIRHRDATTEAVTAAASGPSPSTIRLLRQGFLVGVSNPKTIVFFIAVLPQFVDFRSDAIPAQMMLLGLIFLGISVASDTVWAVVAGTARAWFARSPKRLSQVSAGGGITMIGLGAVLAVSGNKH
ncbi:LysE family translocator [Glaciihabitans sp. dw_435]|uniref:LysE family translocator n=1 Tax=Glaciihabitans sp. dw_435 TaxID=2720081 RepID=UPI001BD5CE31|nr:LysE family translocator [Glaciihabitans sp. dw_435]